MKQQVSHRPRQVLLARPRSIVFWAACLSMAQALAAEPSGALTVTATVAKRASLRVIAQPGSVLVTQTDLERGYVEVPAPVEVAVLSNSPAGYVLVLATQHDYVGQVLMSGLDADVQLGPQGGLVPQRSGGGGVLRKTLQLKFRFILARHAQRGEHPWPMQLSVAPL